MVVEGAKAAPGGLEVAVGQTLCYVVQELLRRGAGWRLRSARAAAEQERGKASPAAGFESAKARQACSQPLLALGVPAVQRGTVVRQGRGGETRPVGRTKPSHSKWAVTAGSGLGMAEDRVADGERGAVRTLAARITRSDGESDLFVGRLGACKRVLAVHPKGLLEEHPPTFREDSLGCALERSLRGFQQSNRSTSHRPSPQWQSIRAGPCPSAPDPKVVTAIVGSEVTVAAAPAPDWPWL